MKNLKLNVRLDEVTINKVRAIASENNISQSELIENLIFAYDVMKRHKKAMEVNGNERDRERIADYDWIQNIIEGKA